MNLCSLKCYRQSICLVTSVMTLGLWQTNKKKYWAICSKPSITTLSSVVLSTLLTERSLFTVIIFYLKFDIFLNSFSLQSINRLKKLHTKSSVVLKSWLQYIWNVLCNLLPFAQFEKREKQPWRSDAFSTTLLKVTILHGCFSRFYNCTNSTKSRNASQVN